MSIAEIVTARVLDQIGAGQVPWRKPWKAGLPRNLGTRREFRAVNLLLLGGADFTSRYWLTSRQAQQLGGQVRQGERAAPVVCWKRHTPDAPRGRDEQPAPGEPAPGVPCIWAVFNLDQVEGVPAPADDQPRRADRFQVAEQMLEVMPDQPEIVHLQTRQPGYSPRRDRLTLPHLSQFQSADEYYSLLFRGLVLCTGAGHRLNRFGGMAGECSPPYSFEALVAELGTAFLCGFTGMAPGCPRLLPPDDLENWAQVLRRDGQILLRAAAAAQRAADYIRGKLIPEPPRRAAPAAPLPESNRRQFPPELLAMARSSC